MGKVQTSVKNPPSNKMMHRASSEVSIEEIDEEARTVTLSFVSEQSVSRWFGSEVLQVDEKSMVLSRFQNGLGCLLFNHNRDKVLGKILKAWQSDRKGYAKVQFDEGEEEEKIFNKVKTKTLQGTSVGYNVSVWEKVEAGKKSTSGRVMGPAYVAVRWEPIEISITPIPADDSVGVGRNIEDMEERGMEENETTTNTGEKRGVEGTSNIDEIKKVAKEEERRRNIEIVSLCREFNIDPETFLNKGKSIDEVRGLVLNKLKESSQASTTARHILFGESEHDKFSRAASDAILLRGGVILDKPADGAQQLRNLNLREIFIESLERSGVERARYMNEEELIRESRMGTGALPGILSSVVNKTVTDTYKAAPATFEQWTREGSVNDFKEVPSYTLSEAGSLMEIKESGEFKHDAIKESATKRKVLSYGRKWSLTRQAIINDDLSALITLPQKYSIASRRGINRLVYKTLAESSLFIAKNNNLAKNGGVPSVKSIGEGRAAMRKQKNIRGEETLNIVPKFIIIPSDLETMTEQLIYSVTDSAYTNANVTNPFANKLNIICDAELDNLLSVPAWFLAAHPALADTIQVDYLRGQKEPKIDMQESFDILGFQWRIYIDYGVTMLDYKGLYKNPGQALG